MPRRRRYLTALAAGATGLVAGCRGGDSDSEQTATPTRTGGSTGEEPWQQTTRLSPAADEADGFDRFGSALALDSDGTTALVGAPGDGTRDHLEIGASYVLVREDGDWTRQTELTAPDRRGDERFGCSVALSADGTTALVGANGRRVDGVTSAGAAYVFSAAGGAWTRETELTAPDGEFQDHFGSSVALSADGTTALVGTPDEDGPSGRQEGSAVIYTADGEVWTQAAKLSLEVGEYGKFGCSVALSDDGATALVGAKGATVSGTYATGAAYVFAPGADGWRQQSELTADEGEGGDFFGNSVALSADGTTALVGAADTDDRTGVAYVFTDAGERWSQLAKLADPNGDSDDQFGASVALPADGTTALVGAATDEDPNGRRGGATYVATDDGDGWTLTTKLDSPDGGEDDEFGMAVALDEEGATALVGAPGAGGTDSVPEGLAYVFE